MCILINSLITCNKFLNKFGDLRLINNENNNVICVYTCKWFCHSQAKVIIEGYGSQVKKTKY